MTPELRLQHLLLVLLLLFGIFCIGASAAATPVFQGTQKAHNGAAVGETAAAHSSDGPTPLPARGGLRSAGSAPGAHAVQVSQGLRRMELTAEEQTDLERLRSLMMEADAAGTEVISTSRYLFGLVPQRLKRHLVVDLLCLMLLFAGYYVAVSGHDATLAQNVVPRTSKF